MTAEITLAALLIAGFLLGIHLMQSPRTALWGNRLGALCMLGAVILTMAGIKAFGDLPLWGLLLTGGLLGIALGQKVKMIQMPQTVALLNGFGGGASALVAVTAVSLYRGDMPAFWFTAALALGVGVLTFSGSLVAALKLQGLVSQRPLVVKNHAGLLRFFLGAGALLVVLGTFWQEPSLLFPLITVTFTLYGLLMALRVGGADMPVIISFLNSLSGVAASISGLAVENPLLVGVGALVGVAGLILTQIMCRAMNRNLSSVLSGFKKALKKEAVREREEAVAGEKEAAAGEKEASPGESLKSVLTKAAKVILIPGYGMALAQAQKAVKDFIDAAQAAGKEVRVAIHPVAGRMPGHMHVLLAEVGIDYEMLHDLEEINPEFPAADLVVVVGACDVINPAANTAEGTPIYGMPVLNAVEARHVIVCNLDEKPGYSGVDNTLYDESHVFKLWGNAAETVPSLTALLRGEGEGGVCPIPAETGAPDEGPSGEEASPEELLCRILPPAEKVLIVPGYGMALAQAQQAVKDLMDALEKAGKEVKVAIHPVAGRMPGHMHVLLAEVGIDYEKLNDMEAINPEFPLTDLVVVVGACDVINPAANTAEGTPIYGMPVLNVVEARRVIVCNLDDKPGYSGVDNTLYGESHVIKLWGNAAETVPMITRSLGHSG